MKSAHNRIELTGLTFNNWTVVGRAPARYGGVSYYHCKCACGAERQIQGRSLRSGVSRSCGCLNGISYSRHGSSYKREYRIWQGMRNRCKNPNADHFNRYGGRGIKVCEAWDNSFETFLADVGDMPTSLHTLDRIDNDGNYEPGNVRWATRKEQAINRHQARVSLANRRRDARGRLTSSDS